MKTLKTLIAALLITATAYAQNVGINTDGAAPDASAMLDVKSTSKGLLIPNVALTGIADATTIATPAVSLLVYNTATASGLTPGYYYNSGTTGSPIWTRLITDIADGSETKLTVGSNLSISGTGTSVNPYVVNVTAANGSETKVTAGTNITLTGAGTTASPYVVSATAAIAYGDIKQGIQSTDHNGWIKLDGRLKSSLAASQQAQATTLGIGTNLPNASNSFPVQNGTTLGSVNGSNTVTIAKNQLPNVTYSGTLYDVAHGAYVSATANGVFTRYGNGHVGNATGSGGTNDFTLNIQLNGGVTQQALNITPQSLSVNMFIYLGL